MEKKQCCWVLTGPTASGKTGLSIRLAKEFDCEIVCMDSMQIYRRMDIGTAKPTRKEMDGVPHHMLDISEPWESFSVAQYQAMAEACFREIHARGRQVLLVVGTVLYLRALRQPMAMGDAGADQSLRDELQALADAPGGRERLHAMLEEVDPATAARLHLNDVRRAIRALEVFRSTGVPFSRQPQKPTEVDFDYRVATLTMDRERLYRRIEDRVDQMMRDGLMEEVRALLAEGITPSAQAMKGLGYKELAPYVLGQSNLEQAVDAIKLGTRRYAKRQLTWMRREEDVLWVDSLSADAYDQLKNWYTRGVEA